MEEQINELKDFFGTLTEDSPISKSLQNLVNEVKRVAEAATKGQKQDVAESSEPEISEEMTGDQPNRNDANETMTNDDGSDTATNDTNGSDATTDDTNGSDATTDDTNGSDATTDDDDTDDATPEWMKSLEDLMMDNEFITASAGFVLGAVTVGLGVTLISAMRK